MPAQVTGQITEMAPSARQLIAVSQELKEAVGQFTIDDADVKVRESGPDSRDGGEEPALAEQPANTNGAAARVKVPA